MTCWARDLVHGLKFGPRSLQFFVFSAYLANGAALGWGWGVPPNGFENAVHEWLHESLGFVGFGQLLTVPSRSMCCSRS